MIFLGEGDEIVKMFKLEVEKGQTSFMNPRKKIDRDLGMKIEEMGYFGENRPSGDIVVMVVFEKVDHLFMILVIFVKKRNEWSGVNERFFHGAWL